MDTLIKGSKNQTKDTFPLLGTDFIEFYVGNAKQSALYYMAGMGFTPLAYSGLETGNTDKVSYVLQQGKIRLVLTSSYKSDSEVSSHVKKHGDGVKDIALWVDDAHYSYHTALERGAEAASEFEVLEDNNGVLKRGSIKTYGDTIHTFIERKDYKGVFMPGFIEWKSKREVKPIGLLYVDHCVGNVGYGEMNKWVDFYEKVMGFNLLITFDDKDISTKYTALMSKVVSNDNGYVKFPINEPAKGLKKSQIEEYLDFYEGSGCQHIAVATDDIVFTVDQMRKNGIEFLYVPDNYYDTVLDRVGNIEEDLELMKKHNILIDRDDEGYLLQLFTKPVQDRPTVFYEIIQRKGAKSFGKGNFQALFESIEREQELRGTL
jgi:4-hydroxyphenylpyruvate dioxygenase